MWKLSRRDYVIKQYSECGSFNNLVDAARHICQLEGKDELISFRVYVDGSGLYDDII